MGYPPRGWPDPNALGPQGSFISPPSFLDLFRPIFSRFGFSTTSPRPAFRRLKGLVRGGVGTFESLVKRWKSDFKLLKMHFSQSGQSFIQVKARSTSCLPSSHDHHPVEAVKSWEIPSCSTSPQRIGAKFKSSQFEFCQALCKHSTPLSRRWRKFLMVRTQSHPLPQKPNCRFVSQSDAFSNTHSLTTFCKSQWHNNNSSWNGEGKVSFFQGQQLPRS